MPFEEQRRQLGYRGGRGSQLQAFVAKTLAAVAASVMLIGAIAMSIVLFVVALAVLLVGGIFVWWKIRQLRKVAAAQFEHYQQQYEQRDTAEGNIIEGVVIREERTRESSQRER